MAGRSPAQSSRARGRGRRRSRGWTTRKSPRPPASPASPPAAAEGEPPPLPPGAEVEVRVDDEGFHGSWFEATVVGFAPARGPRSPARYTVTYIHLVADDGSVLTEFFAPTHIRPRPPPSPPPRFAPHDVVEAFHKDGWWSGIVVAADDDAAFVTVAFPVTREVISFAPRLVRPRREFVGGEWVPSGTVVAVKPKGAVKVYEVGEKVEVGREREVYGYSWFPATVAKVVDPCSYIVEYFDLEEEDDGKKATEYLHWSYIRPAVDHCPRESEFQFGIGAAVEAYCDGAWSPGVVIRVVDDSEYEVSIDGKKGKQLVTKVVELLKPQYKWNGKNWRIVIAKRRANLRRRSNPGKSPSFPVDVISSDDEHSRDPESYAIKKSRNEQEELAVIVADGSEHASVPLMVTPLSALRHSTPENDPRLNCIGETVVNQEILYEKTSSYDMLNTPVSGTSAGDAEVMLSIAELRKQLASAQRNNTAQETRATLLSAKALKVKKGSKSKGGKTRPIQELQGLNGASDNIQLKGNIDFSTTEIICGLSASVECQTTSAPDDGQVSRRAKSGPYAKVKKLANKKGSEELCSPHNLFDATSTVQQKGRKKVVESMKESSLLKSTESQTQLLLDRDAQGINGVTNQEPYPSIPPGFESMYNGKGIVTNGSVLEKEMTSTFNGSCRTNRNVDLFTDNSGTKVAKSNCPMEAPMPSLDHLVQQYEGRVDKRSILVSLKNSGSSQCTTDKTLLRSCSVAGSSMPSQLPLSEVCGNEVLFDKKSPLWSLIEAMDVFKKFPQRPHFRPLNDYILPLREGMALGLMVSFLSLVESVRDASIDNSMESLKDNFTTLGHLEDNGFNVQFLRHILLKWVKIKSDYTSHLREKEMLEGQLMALTTSVSQKDALLDEKDKATSELEQKLKQLRGEAQQVAKKKEHEEAELVRLQVRLQEHVSRERGFFIVSDELRLDL
ncbi:hypothetical protein ACP4OV_027178 [Aristida adscensionis]